MKKVLIWILVFFIFISKFSWPATAKDIDIALFIPGVIGGNPIFELMTDGVKKAKEEFGFSLNIVEGGYNPGGWEDQFKALVLTGKYEYIVTVTEGMPDIIKRVSSFSPKTKYLLLDGEINGVKNAFGIKFKDREMTYLAGVFAGLVTLSSMEYANPLKKIGLIAGDIYPAMENELLPGYREGACLVDKEISVVFSSVGNWNDPGKGREIAVAQYNQGVDIILNIAGASGIGIIDAAKKKRGYVIAVDTNQNKKAPGIIIGSALKKIDVATYEVIRDALSGKIPYGRTRWEGIESGKIGFTLDDPYFKRYVPKEIQEEMRKIVEEIKKGELKI